MDAIQELLEIEAIRRLKYRYLRALDWKLWDEMRECFVADATSSYGDGKFSFSGRDAILKFLVDAMGRPGVLSAHHCHHPEIELSSPTTASGVWALEDTFIDTDAGITVHGAAFYRDEYVKRGGSWRIQHTGYERTFEEVLRRAEVPGLELTAHRWKKPAP
jgi:hypothetical protein